MGNKIRFHDNVSRFQEKVMEMKILAQQLGISHQMANRLKRQGMDCSSLAAAQAWRKANIDPFRSKTGRIGGGNTGKKYQPKQSKEDASAPDEIYTAEEINGVKKALTKIIPGLWFGQIGWLGTALRERGIKVTAEQLIEAQSVLFMIYMSEITDYLELDEDKTFFEIPSALMARPGDEIYPSLIASLNQILSKE